MTVYSPLAAIARVLSRTAGVYFTGDRVPRKILFCKTRHFFGHTGKLRYRCDLSLRCRESRRVTADSRQRGAANGANPRAETDRLGGATGSQEFYGNNGKAPRL